MEGGPPPGIIKTYVEEGEQKANKTSGSITKNQENKSKFPLLRRKFFFILAVVCCWALICFRPHGPISHVSFEGGLSVIFPPLFDE